MLGISPRRRAGRAAAPMVALLAVVLGLGGCAHNVKQDAKTGKDGRYKGAKAVKIENNEGTASGIVTYPGGDRIDWKLIELPEGKRGTLKLALSWTPPRPGLDLSFKVFNEWGRELGSVKPKKAAASKKSKNKRGKKSLELADTRGKIYVMIYASTRGDAGKYRLQVEFAEDTPEAVFDPGAVPIPEPPKLAMVPPPCDPTNIDPKNPECKGVYPPCDPAKPDKTNPNCTGIHPPCDPAALDRNNPNCKALFPECDVMNIDPNNPKCDGKTKPKPKPLDGSIIAVEPTSGETIIHINLGTESGVGIGWTGEVVDSSGRPVANGAFKVFKAQKNKSFAKTKLPKATIDKNLQVRIYPPE